MNDVTKSRQRRDLPGYLGNSLSCEQPCSKISSRWCNEWMLLGRPMRARSSMRLSRSSATKFPMDESSSPMAFPWSKSCFNPSTWAWISGNFFSFQHPSKTRLFRDFDLRDIGKWLRFLQFKKLRCTSFLSVPRDSWTASKLVHHLRSKLSRFVIENASGTLVSSSQWLKSIYFRLCKV